jgi:FkbM family methyltransferase
MKKVNGIWLTDSETHLVPWIQKDGSYQSLTRIEALSHVKNPKNAIDIGAHCGLWAMDMCKFFNHVYAFEPVEAHRQCFTANLDDRVSDWTLFPCALGDRNGEVMMEIEADNTGHTHIGDKGEPAELRRLDEFDLRDISFIKMDCEGYEYFVCLGAKETILREKPIICLEQKPHGFYDIHTHAGVRLLAEWGMREIGRIRQDFIMGW